MKLDRLLRTSVALVGLAVPLSAVAQPLNGSVTTDTLSAGAVPALGMPMLVLAAILLIGLGVFGIRSRAARTTARLVVPAGVMVLAAFSDAAPPSVVVQGAACNMQTVHAYSSFEPTLLDNQCPNNIKIVAIDPGCKEPPPGLAAPLLPPDCTVGQVLASGESCALPTCGERG